MRIQTRYGIIDIPKYTMYKGSKYTFMKAKKTMSEANKEYRSMYSTKFKMYTIRTPIVSGKNKGKGLYAMYLSWRK